MPSPRRARFTAHLASLTLATFALPSLLALAVEPRAWADGAASDADRATARALGQDGEDALEKKDFALAEDRFRRADALYHAPTLALGLARAQAGLGRLVTAEETYRRIVREGVAAGAPAPFVRAVEQARTEVAAVSARVGSVVLEVTGPAAPAVRVDDVPVPSAALGVKRPIDPGTHTVKVTADGWTPVEASFTVAEGAQVAFPVSLTPAPASAPAGVVPVGAADAPAPVPDAAARAPSSAADPAQPRRVAGYVTLAAGGAFVLAGGALGIAALAKHGSLSSRCPGDRCPAELQGDVSTFHTLGTLSTLGFVVGGVAAATGAVLVFTAPARSGSAAALVVLPEVVVSDGGARFGAVGRF